MIDWDSIDTVLLDMDGTLLDLQFDNFFWQEHLPRIYARENGLTEADSSELLMSRFTADQGTLQWYCLDHWSEQLQIDIAALKQEMKHLVRVRPHTLEFLRRLHASPRDVLMVTNAHRKTLDIKMGSVDLTRWFDRLVVSHELDSPKEDPTFWDRLQLLHPFEPARTLLIDDTESVLESARTHGIAHLLTMIQPDSSLGKRVDTRFPGIHHFDEIMPGEPQA